MLKLLFDERSLNESLSLCDVFTQELDLPVFHCVEKARVGWRGSRGGGSRRGREGEREEGRENDRDLAAQKERQSAGESLAIYPVDFFSSLNRMSLQP